MNLTDIRRANGILQVIDKLERKTTELTKLGASLALTQDDNQIKLVLEYPKSREHEPVLGDDGSIAKGYVSGQDPTADFNGFLLPLLQRMSGYKETVKVETIGTQIDNSECLLIIDALIRWNQSRIIDLKLQLRALTEA